MAKILLLHLKKKKRIYQNAWNILEEKFQSNGESCFVLILTSFTFNSKLEKDRVSILFNSNYNNTDGMIFHFVIISGRGNLTWVARKPSVFFNF